MRSPIALPLKASWPDASEPRTLSIRSRWIAVLAPFAEFLSTVTLHAPRIPMLSNITGTWMTDEEATDPNRWAQHIRSTVRFADELQDTARRQRTGCSSRWDPAAV